MKLSRVVRVVVAVAFVAAFKPAFSQTAPEAYQGTLPFTIGAGASNIDVDWDKSRMYGITVWAQWHPGMLPSALYGLGLEAEGRDVNYGRPAGKFPPTSGWTLLAAARSTPGITSATSSHMESS